MSQGIRPLPWVFDDGGRAAAGFKGSTGDCTCRSIAIATQRSYRDVYDELNDLGRRERANRRGKRSSARTGVRRATIKRYLADLPWTPTMGIGTGCQVHLREGELPEGRLIVSCSGHMTAVVDGVVRDTHDPCREGTRCVYGYWTAPVLEAATPHKAFVALLKSATDAQRIKAPNEADLQLLDAAIEDVREMLLQFVAGGS